MIKKYNEFIKESSEIDETISYIRDILLPLEDDGIEVFVDKSICDTYIWIYIGDDTIHPSDSVESKFDNQFNLEEYKDSFKHLFSYLKESRYLFDRDESIGSKNPKSVNYDILYSDNEDQFFSNLNKKIIFTEMTFSN